MSDEIFNRQIEALKSELQRENDRHNRELSAIDNRKHSENDTHNKRKQNIQSRIERVKSNKKAYSNEDFYVSDIKKIKDDLINQLNDIEVSSIQKLNDELISLCEEKKKNKLFLALNC